MYVVTEELQADIEKRFTYHRPGGDQPERYQALRGYARELALTMCRLVPESRERSLAVGKLEEAIFWANAGIARRESWHEPTPDPGLPAGFEPLKFYLTESLTPAEKPPAQHVAVDPVVLGGAAGGLPKPVTPADLPTVG
jgi:hypothetical protein